MTPTELREARQTLGLSQTALGESLGIGKRQIIRIESGDTPLRPIYAREVARLLAEAGH
jgi:predicted transcriptional regulator